MPGPLSGVRVLDLTGVVSGPYATMFLADQGADVLKIEPLGGDITRRSRPADRQGRGVLGAVHLVQPRQALALDRHQERRRPRGPGQAGRRRPTCWCRIFAPARWSGSGSASRNCASDIRA